MPKLVEVLVKPAEITPKTFQEKLYVNPEDVSHLYLDSRNQGWISFKNGKIYPLFNSVESVREQLRQN